jgi:putative membrane protein
MNAFVAFLHHLCFVAIMVILSAEMLMLKQPLTLTSAKKILRFDTIYGAAAGLVLLIGGLRVMYFEKGAAYYMHSVPFIAKMALFVIVGLVSIYPTMTFLKWNKSLKQGIVPEISDTQNRTLRIIIHVELTLLLLMILCAAMMAKGMGYFGG